MKNKIKSLIKYIIIFFLRLIFPPNKKNRYINIGGGIWYYPKWENIDYYTNKFYVNYKIDLRIKQGIPLESNSTQIIFSSHFFEHISNDDGKFILKECFRLLKKNGLIRISVPDMDKAFKAYYSNDLVFFKNGGVECQGENIEQNLVNYFASYDKDDYSGGPIVPAEKIKSKLSELDKYNFCKWCVSMIPIDAPYKAHINAFDYSKLNKMLKNAGFNNITKSEYKKSTLNILRGNFFDNRPVVSLFVEATK